MKQISQALRMYLFMTLLLGCIYPLAITFVGQTVFPEQANGSFLERKGQRVGSRLIAQKFQKEVYFFPRPSAVDYNPLPSGGSNLGPTSQTLMETVKNREEKGSTRFPKDLIFASGSGLDPELSKEAALYQVPRIAKARGVPEDEIRDIVVRFIQKRQWGFLGEERVNVLLLNLALDERR